MSRPTSRRCPVGKKRFRSHREAVEALHRATRARDLGALWRREVRCYECAECQGWHLSSRPDWNNPPTEAPTAVESTSVYDLFEGQDLPAQLTLSSTVVEWDD